MQQTPTDAERPVDTSRRRFTRGSFAAPVVLGSLVSQPVLGAGVPYICTVSGKMSGNTSAPRDRNFNCKTLGRSPGYWKNKDAWVGYVRGSVENCTAPTGSTFNAAFGVNAFVQRDCKVYDSAGVYPAGCTPATMLQVLLTGGGLYEHGIFALGRAAVASLLNAASPTYKMSYPLTPQEVMRLFKGVYRGGLVQVNGTVQWNANQVKDYFESLYDGL